MLGFKSSVTFMLLLSFVQLGISQGGERKLSMNFKFEDGIYFSFESWKNNRPDLSWEEVETRLASNPKTFIAQVEYIQLKNGDPLSMEKIWGISLAGVPYIRLNDADTKYSATAFAGLKVRGKINYFSYEKQVEERVVIKAYNPLTRKPFRKGEVPRQKTVEVEKIMHFDSGEIVDFNYVNLLLWIEDDPKLKESVFDLKPSEIEEKLYKCLLIYDDRNEVFVPSSK